jgi:phosphoglycerate dehydrogenase-like enzyme
VIRVWLPDPVDDLPDTVVADIWDGTEPLPDSEPEIIVVPMGVPRELLVQAFSRPSLRLVQLRSAGAERVIPLIPDGVILCNARGAHDVAVAEWIVGVIIARLRDFQQFEDAQREGRWEKGTVGEAVQGKHVLIVGYGSIGEAVEKLLDPFGVTFERIARHARDGVRADADLPDVLPAADVVILLVPLTPETEKLAGAKFLAAMKDGALLVNAARGGIVDTDALLAELRTARLRAALDVTDPEPLPAGHPLWSAPGLLLTPHIAGALTDGIARANVIVRDQIKRYAVGQPLENIVGPAGY